MMCKAVPLSRVRQLVGAAAAALAVLFLSEPESVAHALVVSSSPGVNATVSEPAFDVRVRFNSRVDAKRSKLSVISESGEIIPIDLVDSGAADLLAGRVTGLPLGSYRIRWQVLAVDGHITRGDIPFTVAAPE
jgi:hypothetical protein